MFDHENGSEPSAEKSGSSVQLTSTSSVSELERILNESSPQGERQNLGTSNCSSDAEEEMFDSEYVDELITKFYCREYPVTQINGCRQYGPPRNWIGTAPGFGCEIYVKRIPPEFTEADLVPLFERFGRLYELRLMMDYNNQNRRYCFVRYINEEDAKVAIEVLNHYFVQDNQTLEVQRSFEKCRLFIGNLPKDVDRRTIEIAFRSLFPEMTRFVMHNRISDGEMNRGFAFMDFPDHRAALRAKKQTTPGCMRMWDRDIKIVWANPQRSLDHTVVDDGKMLFVRNIEQKVTTSDLYNLFTRLVPREDIIKITRVREFAFVEFAHRQQAEMVMNVAQGHILIKYPLDIEWAMPPLRNTFQNMKNYDFDSLLRLKCVANEWDPPIIIYGRVFTLPRLQYVAVMMRRNKQVYAYFFEVHTTGLADIQSRVCEGIITLILERGVLPEPYLIMKIKQDAVQIVGSVSSLSQPYLLLAKDVSATQELYWTEILDLCEAANQFLKYSFDGLYTLYEREILKGVLFPYLNTIHLKDRIVGCLCQSFRRQQSLNSRLDNREMVFVLCDQFSLTNYNYSKKNNCTAEQLSSVKNVGTAIFGYRTIPMLPSRIVQAGSGADHNAVYFGLNYYSFIDVDYTISRLVYAPYQVPFQGNMLPLSANCSQPPLPPETMQQMVPCMFNPVAPPNVFNGDVSLLTQAMQQLGINYGSAVAYPPPFGSSHCW